MFADENRDGQIEATENLIHREGPPGEGITVSANAPVKDYVSYTSYGYARLLNGALQMGTFVVCKRGQTQFMLCWPTAAAPASFARPSLVLADRFAAVNDLLSAPCCAGAAER